VAVNLTWTQLHCWCVAYVSHVWNSPLSYSDVCCTVVCTSPVSCCFLAGLACLSSPVYTMQPVVKPVVKPVWQPGKMFVYTIQPAVKPVVKPIWQTAVSCIHPVVKPVVKPVWQPVWQPVECLFTRYSRLSNQMYNRFDNRLYRVNGVSQWLL